MSDDRSCVHNLHVLPYVIENIICTVLFVQTIFGQVMTPQLMVTEGFLQNLPKRTQSTTSLTNPPDYADLPEPDDEELFEEEGELTLPPKLRAFRQLVY
jgi:hypothetical protein